ncbi:hypothetical protein BU16DRAFT_545174 [Lophium mytilinum]|uniref:Uncharacterized protein n=1 Tax=Lophium mytilinum TaxID=390894 RepID=A0A6A6Q9G9_9PEZI|nr:hypothetical protein BU16DRAFT_545174 [Lophium mytilinum]
MHKIEAYLEASQKRLRNYQDTSRYTTQQDGAPKRTNLEEPDIKETGTRDNDLPYLPSNPLLSKQKEKEDYGNIDLKSKNSQESLNVALENSKIEVKEYNEPGYTPHNPPETQKEEKEIYSDINLNSRNSPESLNTANLEVLNPALGSSDEFYTQMEKRWNSSLHD